MARFEFKEHGCPLALDIAGHAFTLNVTKSTAEKLERYGKEAQRLGAELPETSEGVEQAWGFMQGALDGLLGTGATDTIFAGRDRDLMDIADIMTYICSEIEQAMKRQEASAAHLIDLPVPGAQQQAVEQALRIMQAPEVVAAISKAVGQV